MSPNSGTIRLAAARDGEPISAHIIADWSVASHWDTYKTECLKHERTPDGDRWRVARSIFVGETNDEAENFVLDPQHSYMQYYKYLFGIFERAEMKAPFIINPDDDPATRTVIKLISQCAPALISFFLSSPLNGG